MPKIALKYIEEESQKTLSLSEGEVQPLGFDDLVGLLGKLDQPISFPLRLSNVRVGESEFDGIDSNQVHSVAATLNSTHGSTILALMKGGWLPSGLALHDALILPDRCTVGAIRSRFIGGRVKPEKPDDFLNFAADRPLRINPLLYAMEGVTGRSAPDETELSELVDRASSKIQEALPNALIFPDKVSLIQGASGLLRDMADSFARKQKFLVKAAPLVAPAIGNATRPGVWRELFELAERYAVNRRSVLMVALLSSTSAKQGLNPAKMLLKPKRNYKEKDAYNALCDLRALDLLIAAQADFPQESVAFLTEDRALALLWAGLQTHSHRREGQDIQYSINPHRTLFATLADAQLSEMFNLLNA